MTIHVMDPLEDDEETLCGNQQLEDEYITLADALDPTSEKHFDCVECHMELTRGKKHSND